MGSQAPQVTSVKIRWTPCEKGFGLRSRYSRLELDEDAAAAPPAFMNTFGPWDLDDCSAHLLDSSAARRAKSIVSPQCLHFLAEARTCSPQNGHSLDASASSLLWTARTGCACICTMTSDGQRLKEVRTGRGMSQAQLADQAEVTLS